MKKIWLLSVVYVMIYTYLDTIIPCIILMLERHPGCVKINKKYICTLTYHPTAILGTHKAPCISGALPCDCLLPVLLPPFACFAVK